MKEPRSEASAKIGVLIQTLRSRTTLSRRKLAELADMDVSHLARIEAGQGNPTVETLIQLATALDVQPEIFVQGLTAADLPDRVRPLSVAGYRAMLRDRDQQTSA